MMRRLGLALLLLVGGAWMMLAAEPLSVYVQTSGGMVQVSLDAFPRVEGTVAYEGPAMDDGSTNWKEAHTYVGVSLRAILQSIGELDSVDRLGVVAVDGWYKMLPARVLDGDTAAGIPILAISKDGQSGDDWEDAPVLVFLPEDEAFSNDDMLAAIGPDLAHYYGDKPSTTGMMVKAVQYLVPNYNGDELPLQPEAVSAETATIPTDATLTIIHGDETLIYSLRGIEDLETLTGTGTFTNSNNVDDTAVYTGVPLTTLIGNVPGDATILVTASDGYAMTYPASMFQDTSEGTWILAYKENGAYMPLDPGYFRIVLIGDSNPHFSSSLSARMVETIEVQGAYEPYTLTLSGAVERVFSRGELEAGIGCPCHTSTVSVTSKGETNEYTGLPLWRLLAYVDDDVFPALQEGIHYNDSDFNDQLAGHGYAIDLVALDGYTQTVTSDLVAHDDRFIVAFKKNGAFLDPASEGTMRFVFDDSVSLPDDMNLRSVKFLTDILLHL